MDKIDDDLYGQNLILNFEFKNFISRFKLNYGRLFLLIEYCERLYLFFFLYLFDVKLWWKSESIDPSLLVSGFSFWLPLSELSYWAENSSLFSENSIACLKFLDSGTSRPTAEPSSLSTSISLEPDSD